MAADRSIPFSVSDSPQTRTAYLNYLMGYWTYAPGSFTVADGNGRTAVKRVTLRNSERATLVGDARLVICG